MPQLLCGEGLFRIDDPESIDNDEGPRVSLCDACCRALREFHFVKVEVFHPFDVKLLLYSIHGWAWVASLPAAQVEKQVDCQLSDRPVS